MQIHELNTFVGTPSATDYLAIDDGTETNKVPATALGVSTQMTQAEAEAGAVTEPRVVTPAVFKSSVDSLAETVAEKREVVVVEITSFSSLPKTVNDSNITSGMVVINAVFGNPSAQIGDWTATTSNGSVGLTGTISGSTTLTLYLMKSKSGTSTSTIKSMYKDITNEYFSSLGSMSIVSSDSSVYQCGHIITVNLTLSASSFNSAQNATVAEAYRPKKNINSYAGFVATQWNQVVHVGYNYIGTGGEFVLTDNGSGDKFARVKLTYCI